MRRDVCSRDLHLRAAECFSAVEWSGDRHYSSFYEGHATAISRPFIGHGVQQTARGIRIQDSEYDLHFHC